MFKILSGYILMTIILMSVSKYGISGTLVQYL